jgi:hypothetical protein
MSSFLQPIYFFNAQNFEIFLYLKINFKTTGTANKKFTIPILFPVTRVSLETTSRIKFIHPTYFLRPEQVMKYNYFCSPQAGSYQAAAEV